MPLPDDRQDALAWATVAMHRARLAAAVLFAALVMAAAAAVALGWHRELSLEALIRHRAAIEALVAAHPVATWFTYLAIYAVAAGCSMPGVMFLTIGGGATFGWLAGGIAAAIGACAGATTVFLLVRTALGTALTRRLSPLAGRFADGFRDDAFNYLLFMRLVPLFPFFLVNLVPALCGVGLTTFVAATLLGVIPGTIAFALFGAGLDSAVAAPIAQYRACLSTGEATCELAFDIGMVLTPQLLAGLGAFGLAALAPVLLRRFKPRLTGR